ncbi:hypothetical protein [Micromonospora purpureochromogenes]|uniref:Immunity protein Imm1 n=1 Tax=Micromonospora purpureochromogenes TaxID=47872 RepID=A0ABX2RM14_9ACTN|nr:hypothetical protein [Micromonospora purpureochromogenes]NYF56339.1 hypothetical protein [Micromonospora purpureochromogenes]
MIFVPKSDDQSWEAALEAAEEAAEEDDNDDLPSGEVWARLLAAARQVLGEVSVFEGAYNYELTHESTGIQLSYYSREAGITVPYWYRAEGAKAIVKSVYQLGEVVEEVTGLPGFGPQPDLPLSSAVAQTELAVRAFDQVAASFAGRGIDSPSNS